MNSSKLINLNAVLTLCFLSVIFFSLRCFAIDASASATITATDPVGFIEEIIKLVAMIKAGTIGSWALAMAILTLVIQAFKLTILKKLLDKNRILTFALSTTFSVALAFVTSMSIGLGWLDSSIATLITSGGAIAIYSAWRALFKK